MNRTGPANHARAIKKAQRQAEALKMRRAGLSYRDIADQLNVSIGRAHGLVSEAITQLIEAVQETADHVRAIELERIDRMIMGLHSSATSGNPAAVAAMLKCMERRAKYLGLDAPTKIAQTDSDGADVDNSIKIVAIPPTMSMDEWRQTFSEKTR